jgi:predicted transcriptional regulator
MDRISLQGKRVADAVLTKPELHGLWTTVREVRAFFGDDHVHMALVVEAGRLVATVERQDLESTLPDTTPAWIVGSLKGRTIGADADLSETVEQMIETGRRRLAVVDGRGNLLGLLCLKANGLGCCSDDDVESRKHAED